MTEEIINTLGHDKIFHDDLLTEYREPWWLGFAEIGPVPRRLENLHECLLAFSADRWRLEGIPRAINPNVWTIQDSRALLIELQSMVRTKANDHVVALEKIQEALGPGFQLQTPREVIQEARDLLHASRSSAASSDE